MNDINIRLKELYDFKGFKTFSDFAQVTGLGHQTASNYIKGKQKPDVDKLSQIIQSFDDISAEWLLTGNGEMLKKIVNKPASISYESKVGRPFYDVDFTLGYEKLDNDVSLHPEFNIDFEPANKEGITWFKAKGSSMLGEIDSGDYVALEEVYDFDWFPLGRIYGVVTKNKFRTIKRVVKSDIKDNYLLVASNPDKIKYPDQNIPKNIITKLFKVVFVIKDLNE